MMTKKTDLPPLPIAGSEGGGRERDYNLINPFLDIVFARKANGNNFTNGVKAPLSARLKELRHSLVMSNSYTFVVPTTKILEWSVDRETLLPYRDLFLQDDCIFSHIIQIPPMSRNNQRARYYPTVNGKTIIIKDGYVHTHKGFNRYVRSAIVSEYVFYPACDFLPPGAEFLVYEVEVPLIGTPMLSAEISPTIATKYEMAVPAKNTFTKNSEDNPSYLLKNTAPADLERMLSAYPQLNRQVLGPMLILIEEFDCSNCTSEDEVLSLFDSVTEESMQKFKQGDASSIQSLARDNDLNGDDITDSIYRFVENSLSDQIWQKLIEIREEADSNLTKTISTIENIDISQIGLPEDFSTEELFTLDRKVWKAAKELGTLSELSSAEDKIEVILKVIHILSSSEPDESMKAKTLHEHGITGTLQSTVSSVNGGGGNGRGTSDTGSTQGQAITVEPKMPVMQGPNVNADILVSLLLVVVCRSGLKYLDTDLFYVRNFTYRDSESGQLGYALLTLEGVLFHIVNEHKQISPLSDQNLRLWQFIKQPPNASTCTETYLRTLSKEQTSWKTIVRSRSPTGESSLMLAIQNKHMGAFQALLSIDESGNSIDFKDRKKGDTKMVFSKEYLLNDTTDSGTTLLMAAVHTEDKSIINQVLEVFLELEEQDIKRYLSLSDSWSRSVSHYFFNAPWLIERIGHLICWEQRDQNGQTPLFALCRSYDHADYNYLMTAGFRAWSESVQKLRPDEQPSILDHMDNKGNTLLHIVKDRHAVEQVLKYDVAINWPNEKGLTPLMVYSKYSRLSAILSLSQQPLIDLERTDFRGLNALDLAKEIQTLNILDGKCCGLASGGWGSAPDPGCSCFAGYGGSETQRLERSERSRGVWGAAPAAGGSGTNRSRNLGVFERSYQRTGDVDHASVVC
ncbi:hypothetical protein AWJ20_586 [Sugiyamaella lignohabitans]|uniref:VPS9 domain-containing protein n=1 Tax=Sugiyamaella lignohabitans TaxID=796027 RepID=A0A167D0R0_9ASCO|nr:uncharacterized protein AWJ20_586 [Sugiyamaella lignohabitans]ANB12336.1 hypothetical protein AWJ20_586 [Sugiyamaella lignohabitans]